MLRCQRVAPRASVRALQRIALPPPRPPTLRFRSYSSTPSSEAPKPTPSAASSPLASKPKPGEGAPFRYPLAWQDPEFYDEKKLEEESRRVFEVCHGCRRCFNLCNSFPRLFELIDKAPEGELAHVPSKEFKSVADDCTLCDMCFITKCPYTPPHEFNIDFPALMLRYRAVERGAPATITTSPTPDAPQKLPPFKYAPEPVATDIDRSLQLRLSNTTQPPLFLRDFYTSTDPMGTLGTLLAPLTNWVTKRGPHRLTRQMLEKLLGISRHADLPAYARRSDMMHSDEDDDEDEGADDLPNPKGPSFGKREAMLFATCLVTYNKPDIGRDALAVLRHNGVHVKADHPMCCGMPQLEAGNIADVVKRAQLVAPMLQSLVKEGLDIVSPVPSCTFMLKHQWPLLLPNNEAVKEVAKKCYDLSEYIVDISKKEGLIQPLEPINEAVTLQHACHARAQNMGFKSKEMLALIPGLQVNAIERCSGHGGSFGVQQRTHEIAVNVGKPVAQIVLRDNKRAKGEELVVKATPKKTIVKTFGGHPIGKHNESVNKASSDAQTTSPPSSNNITDNTATNPTSTPSSSATTSKVTPKHHSVASDCPLAADHLMQIVRDTASVHVPSLHPIQLLARSMKVSQLDQIDDDDKRDD